MKSGQLPADFQIPGADSAAVKNTEGKDDKMDSQSQNGAEAEVNNVEEQENNEAPTPMEQVQFLFFIFF